MLSSGTRGNGSVTSDNVYKNLITLDNKICEIYIPGNEVNLPDGNNLIFNYNNGGIRWKRFIFDNISGSINFNQFKNAPDNGNYSLMSDNNIVSWKKININDDTTGLLNFDKINWPGDYDNFVRSDGNVSKININELIGYPNNESLFLRGDGVFTSIYEFYNNIILNNNIFSLIYDVLLENNVFTINFNASNDSNFILTNNTNSGLKINHYTTNLECSTFFKSMNNSVYFTLHENLLNNNINFQMNIPIDMQNNYKIINLKDPTDLQDAATKQYVDSVAGGGGGTGGLATSDINMQNLYKVINSINPTNLHDLATKGYVDTSISIGTSPGQVSVNINMNGNTITNLTNPINPSDAVNKQYVDDSFPVTIPGTFTKVNVNNKGLVTLGSNIVSNDISDIDVKINSHKLNELTIPNGNINMNNNKIINLSDPQNNSDAATKLYVDTQTGTSSQWTTTGNDIYYDTGSIMIGTNIMPVSLIPAKIYTEGNVKINGDLRVSGDGYFQDTISMSDISLKKNIKTLENSENIIMSLKPVEFTWKETNEKDIGFIAQDIKEIDENLVKKMDDNMLGVKYVKIIPHLVNIIKHQNDIIKQQNCKINEIENMIKSHDMIINKIIEKINI